MDYVITKNILFSNKHLIKRNNRYFLCDEYDEKSILIYDNKFLKKNCIKTLFKVNAINEIDTLFLEKYKNALSYFPNDNINLSDFVSCDEYKKYVNEIITSIEYAISIDRYYFAVFQKQDEFYHSFNESFIDKRVLLEHLKNKEDLQNSILKNYVPNKQGFLQIPEYDRISSRTGRVSIEQGPNVLILNKKYRNIFKSRFKNGKILSLDFSSLETRIFMNFAGLSNIPIDIYQHIKEELFGDKNVDRGDVKKIVISLMYGANDETINKNLNHISYKECEILIKEIKEYICYESCLDNLVKIFSNGVIQNLYGRKILTEERNVVNSFIQSTGVDLAIEGFINIIKNNDNKHFIPLFFIHDALIVDVDDGYEVKNEKVYIDKFQSYFPITISEFYKR